MYYIVETKYVGHYPGDERHINSGRIEIRTEPPLMDTIEKKPRINEWCGKTLDDCSIHGYGAFYTLEAARAEIVHRFGAVGVIAANNDRNQSLGVVEAYRSDSIQMTPEATVKWVYDKVIQDMSMATNDERMAQMLRDYEKEANTTGQTLDQAALMEFMETSRQYLRETESITESGGRADSGQSASIGMSMN